MCLCRLFPGHQQNPEPEAHMRLLENESTMGTIKVQNGTPVGNESMCTTCRNARIIKGFSESEELIFCDSWYPSRAVPFRVRECSEYDDKRLPYKRDLEKIAYILVPKSAGRTVGFLTPEQYREKQEAEEENE
jgi:hypothetical protein